MANHPPKRIWPANLREPQFRGYLLAIVFAGLAWWIRDLVNPALPHLQPFVTFYLAVAVTCWWGGARPATLTAAIGLVLGVASFLPGHPFRDFSSTLAVVAYCAVCGTIILLLYQVRRTAAELSFSNERFRLVSQSTSDAIYDWDLRSGHLWWSEGAERVFGYPRDAIIPTIEWWTEQIHPEDRPRVDASLHAAVDARTHHWCEEYRFRRHGGDYAWIEDRGSFIQDSDGRVVRMLGGMTDVTSRKLAERDLAFFKFLVERAGEPFYVATRANGYRFKWVNQAACRHFQRSCEDLVHMTIPEIDPDFDKLALDEFTRQMRQCGSKIFESTHRRASGEIVPVEISANYIVHNGDEILAGWFHDIGERKRAEQELRASERRAKIAFNQQFQFMVLLAPDGSILDMNELALQVGNVTRKEIIGRNMSEMPWWRDMPDMLSCWPRRLEEAAKAKGPVFSEEQFRIGNGPLRNIDATITAVRNEQGQVELFILQATETTERKLTEEALRQVKVRLELAIDAANLGTWDWNVSKNELIWSDRCKQFLGVSCDNPVTYERFLETVHPDHRDTVKEIVDASFAMRSRYEVEFRTAEKSATAEWLLAKGRLFFDAHGQPVRMSGVVMDITRRRHTEAALQQKSRRVQILADLTWELLSAESPESVVRSLFKELAPELRLDVYFNYIPDPKARQLVLDSAEGIEPAALEGIKSLCFGEMVCGTVAEAKKPWIIQHLQSSSDPKLQFLAQLGLRAYACFPLQVGERLLGTLSFGSRQRDDFSPEDIAYIHTVCHFVALSQERAFHRRELEARVAERTAKLTEAVSELEYFSYTITHDMRAPLRAMQGFGSILRQEADPVLSPDHKEYLRRIMASADRMDNLIQDALNYSKVVSGEFVLKPVDTGALLRDILSSYPQWQPPQAAIHIDSPMPCVLANEAGLTQCFSNLLSNAMKFVPPGRMPEVHIRAEPRDGYVRLWFIDNGIGIPQEYQHKIFGMFQRLHPHFEGTGIGLALVRKAVERMAGRVGVESEAGKGSRFWLEFKECAGR